MLVELDDLKTRLGIALGDTTQDAFLTTEIAIFSETVSNYCNRVFDQTSFTETFYHQDIGDETSYMLYHFPIISVTSVTEKDVDQADVVLTSRVNNRLGQLKVLNSSSFIGRLFQNYTTSASIEVVYEAGYATIPLDIQEAVMSLIQVRYNKKQSGVDLNFGSNVQRINITGVMGIDFDYSLSGNDRNTKYGAILGDYLNVFDSYKSERTIIGDSQVAYL